MSEQSVSKYDLMKITSIVPCTIEDFSDLRALHKMAINAFGWRYYSHQEVAAKLEEIDDPDFTFTLMNETIHLAKIDKLLVGAISWRPSIDHPQTAVVSSLYLHPAFFDGCIATALIQKCEQTAYERGFRWVSALSDLNSRVFFTELGYETKGFSSCKQGRCIQYPLQVMTRHISSQYCQTESKPSSHAETIIPEPVINEQ